MLSHTPHYCPLQHSGTLESDERMLVGASWYEPSKQQRRLQEFPSTITTIIAVLQLAAVIPTLTSHISPPPVISWSAAIGSEAWSRPHFTPSYTSEKHYLEVGERWVDPLLLQLANSHRHQVHNTCNQFLTQRNWVWSIWLPKGTHAYDWSGYTCPVVLPRVRSIKIQDHMHTNLSSITD